MLHALKKIECDAGGWGGGWGGAGGISGCCVIVQRCMCMVEWGVWCIGGGV